VNPRRGKSLGCVIVAAWIGVGCASGSSYYVPTQTAFAGEEAASANYVSEESYGGDAQMVDFGGAPETTAAYAQSAPSRRERGGGRVATNTPQPPPQAATSATTGTTTPPASPDAPAVRDLIIYTADVTLAIYEVDTTQRAIAAAATEIGGFIANLDERTLIVRIPAAQFDAFLATIEAQGRVLGRRIQADDVTEQFRDLQIRIENLAAMRDRLEAMLGRAANVQEAIAIERELERVTLELESLRGRLRFLADRVAFSTVTIRFQPLPREQLAGNVPTELPVSWLRTLGLSNLMQ